MLSLPPSLLLPLSHVLKLSKLSIFWNEIVVSLPNHIILLLLQETVHTQQK